MTWNTLADLANGTTVTETHMDEIRENIEHLGAMLTGADVALSSKGAGANIGAAMATGSYTGNGTGSHAITGVGFQPRLLVVIGDSAAAPLVGLDVSGTIYTALTDQTGIESSGTNITSFDSDGFTLPAASTINSNTNLYYFAAWE